jgi:putative membrane protein
MTTLRHIKTTIFLIICGILITVISCQNSTKPVDAEKLAEDVNNAKMDNPKDEKDALFMVKAAEISGEEVRMGQLAQQKGMTNDVKELGKMMETDHGKAMADLTAMANRKYINIPTVPTEDSKEAYNKLNEKNGIDFDKAYTALMVNGHTDAIDLFEKASSSCTDVEIKNWAQSMLPGLHTHLDHAMAAQQRLK